MVRGGTHRHNFYIPFDAAQIKKVATLVVHKVSDVDGGFSIDYTFDEIRKAILSGRNVEFWYYREIFPVVQFVPNSSIIFGKFPYTYEVDSITSVVTESIAGSIRLRDTGTGALRTVSVYNGKLNIL